MVIDQSRGDWWPRLTEAFARRELLWMLVRRDIAVRYREALFGILWAVVVPIATMAIYWFVFEKIRGRAAGELPFVLFLFPAMLVWNYFHSCVGRAAQSLVRDGSLLSKIYFPRVLLPVSNVISPMMDAAFGIVILICILVFWQHMPGVELVWIPVFVALAMTAAVGVGMTLAALNAQFKDVQHFLPVMLHMWFFLSPVLYSSRDVPEKFKLLYAVNPMTTVCEGVRYAVLGTPWPLSPAMVAVGVCSTVVLLGVGLTAFMRAEQTITDVL